MLSILHSTFDRMSHALTHMHNKARSSLFFLFHFFSALTVVSVINFDGIEVTEKLLLLLSRWCDELPNNN